MARVALPCMLATACGPLLAANRTPAASLATAEWPGVLVGADQEVSAGRYDAADRMLESFADRYPSAEERSDALFFRALFKLDPANAASGPREAMALLDSYLARGMTAPRYTDAVVLRRVAAALAAKPTTVTVTVPVSSPATSPSPPSHAAEDRARDEELARTREELSKANAELERIRKRLAAPKP